MLSPLGNTAEETWQNLLLGKSGIGSIDHFDASAYPTRFAGLVKDFDAQNYMERKEAKKMDLFIQYGVAAGVQAIKDSGIEVTGENAPRIGVAVGSGIGGLGLIEQNHEKMLKAGGSPRKLSPFFVPSTIINMISGHLSIMFGLQGPNISIVTACTSGVHNIGHAARMIAYGDADVMVAGGAEKASTTLGMGGFGAARALSTRNDDPQAASRPWDKDRDGFVLGDGAGVIVVEEYEHAKARGAKIYAELIGFGMSGDAYHMTSPPADGEGAARAMQNALNDAKIDTSKVGYINAHGTSTPAGDIAETNAVKSVFGAGAYDVMMGSTKSMTGHLLGAAGALESIATLMAVKEGIVPPTINHFTDDDSFDPKLNFTFNKAQKREVRAALSNTFGFGGHNASVLFKKYEA